MANGDGDLQEEDEAVRCVCGNEEYQGPPPLDEDSKHGFKHAFGLESFFSADVTDDTAGLFVQCDVCKVWQHGGCVGIMTEESSPDEYFCEKCRDDLHKLWTASNGSVYSHYLPMKRNGRATSRAASLNKDMARSPTKEKETRNGRGSSANHASKRRSTLNSREAGYDEAEALRRAIEASKEETHSDPPEGANRRPKRGRSDSQEKSENTKRQKTSSRSASPLSDNAEDSDEPGAGGRNGVSKSKARGAAAVRNLRVEKASEKEEKERQRVETANKRKGRADRRRADDSDPSEELPLATRAATQKATQASGASNAAVLSVPEVARPPTAVDPPPASNPAPDTPPTITVQAKADKKRSHKKKGRNQYTRDRDAHDDESPARSQSRDIQKDDHGAPGTGKTGGEGVSKATTKPKGGMSNKINMNDMKKRATALLEYISRTQVELAGESLTETPPSTASDANGSNSGTAPEKAENGTNQTPMLVLGETGHANGPGKEFKELGCVEMMDTLTRRLVKWQQQYAV